MEQFSFLQLYLLRPISKPLPATFLPRKKYGVGDLIVSRQESFVSQVFFFSRLFCILSTNVTSKSHVNGIILQKRKDLLVISSMPCCHVRVICFHTEIFINFSFLQLFFLLCWHVEFCFYLVLWFLKEIPVLAATDAGLVVAVKNHSQCWVSRFSLISFLGRICVSVAHRNCTPVLSLIMNMTTISKEYERR